MFVDAVYQFIPTKRIWVRPGGKPWYTSFVHELARHRDRLYNRSRRADLDSLVKVTYRKVRNWYVRELRNAERVYYRAVLAELSQSASNCNTHRWWSCVNRMLGLKPKDAIPFPLCFTI